MSQPEAGGLTCEERAGRTGWHMLDDQTEAKEYPKNLQLGMHQPIPRGALASTTSSIAILFVAIAAYRLYECTRLPLETGDIARHVLYGAATLKDGFAAAAHPLTDYSPAWTGVSWARFPYSYPPAAQAFFALVAFFSPTIFAAKLALTAIEGCNAWLIRRLSGSPLLALLYWASPLSIWWVSREGQFEPLQAFFCLIAIAASREAPLIAGFGLAFAALTKATGLALLPWVIWTVYSLWGFPGIRKLALGFVLPFVPAAIAEASYGALSNVLRYGTLLIFNPLYWNLRAEMFAGERPWQLILGQLGTYAYIGVLGWLAASSRMILPYFAALVFIAFCKTHHNVQYWYLLMLPTFIMTVPDRRARFALVALCPILDLNSAFELLGHLRDQRTFFGLPSVFSPYVP